MVGLYGRPSPPFSHRATPPLTFFFFATFFLVGSFFILFFVPFCLTTTELYACYGSHKYVWQSNGEGKTALFSLQSDLRLLGPLSFVLGS